MGGEMVPVLLVDDNPGKRVALRSILAPLGYFIVEADSGLTALRCVMEQDFAVILLDVRMPEMNGFETAALIRRRRQSEMTPIIFITAYSTDELPPSARYVEGAVDFMYAPVQPEELRAKVSVFANLFIQAKHLAQEALEVEMTANQLRQLTDAAPIGIFQADPENRFVYTNPRWTEITGISADDATGRTWDSMIDPEHRIAAGPESTSSTVDQAASNRYRIHPEGSDPRVLLMTSEAISDAQGGTSGWVGTLADITAEAGAEAAAELAEKERLRLEGQLRQGQKMEAIGQLAGGIAHDFNNILSVVLNYADFVAATLEEGHEGRSDLKQIVMSAERGAELVRQLLAFSRQEVIRPRVLDLNGVIVGMSALLERSLGEDIELKFEATSDLSLTKVDHGQVEQILLNLVVNARDSMPDGGLIRIITSNVELAEGARSDLPAGHYVCLTVTDTGAGIDPEKLDHIFEPFFTTKARGEGTGLGLATVYGIVQQAKGSIHADAKPGAPTSFVVYLPVTTEQLPVPPKQVATPGTGDATILVVEDEAPVRELVARILRRGGYEVLIAASGTEAIELASKRDGGIDLLLTDVVMPHMSGPALRDALAPLRPEMEVLFMSGYTDDLIAKHGVLDEGDVLISKPFNSSQLLTRVDEALMSRPSQPVVLRAIS